MGRPLTIAGRQFVTTRHAAERWQQRFRSGLSLDEAAADLVRVVEAVGVIAHHPPEWAVEVEEAEQAAVWIVVGDVAFPVVGNRLATCVARGETGETAREERSARRRRKSEVRRQIKAEGRAPRGRGGRRTFRPGAGHRKNKARGA